MASAAGTLRFGLREFEGLAPHLIYRRVVPPERGRALGEPVGENVRGGLLGVRCWQLALPPLPRSTPPAPLPLPALPVLVRP